MSEFLVLPQTASACVLACGAFLKNRAGRVDGTRFAWSALHGDLGEAEACWSIILVAEQCAQEAADAAIGVGAKICLRRGRRIANVTALAGATPIYSVRRFLGRDGERWIATHAIFPVSRAVEVTRATEAFFAARQAEIERHGVRIGYISQVTPVHWQIEPLFYWWDELEELHFRHLTPDEATRFRGLRARPGVREFVLRLRAELRDHFERLGALHVHLSKFFRYAEVLEPGTRELLQDIKDVLDPQGRINPGNLGLRGPRSSAGGAS